MFATAIMALVFQYTTWVLNVRFPWGLHFHYKQITTESTFIFTIIWNYKTISETFVKETQCKQTYIKAIFLLTGVGWAISSRHRRQRMNPVLRLSWGVLWKNPYWRWRCKVSQTVETRQAPGRKQLYFRCFKKFDLCSIYIPCSKHSENCPLILY